MLSIYAIYPTKLHQGIKYVAKSTSAGYTVEDGTEEVVPII